MNKPAADGKKEKNKKDKKEGVIPEVKEALEKVQLNNMYFAVIYLKFLNLFIRIIIVFSIKMILCLWNFSKVMQQTKLYGIMIR